MKIWERVQKAFASKDCKAMDEAVAELKATDADPDGSGTAVHVHTGEGRSAYDDDTLKGLFEDNEKKHAAMDARMKDCESYMQTAKDSKAKDEEAEKKEKEEQAAKDAEKEKEDKEVMDALKDEAPAGEEEKAAAAKDSTYLVESFQTTKAKAEILAPGIHLPAFDKKAAAKDSYIAICGLRRKAIQMAARDTDSLAMILKLNGGKSFDASKLEGWNCGRVKTLFDSLSEMKRLANNAAATKDKTDMAAILNAKDGPVDAESFKSLREKARKGHNVN